MMYLLILLLIVNLVAFALYGIDKYKAKHQKWRITERTLLLIAAVGGSVGALFGMQFFRHKTQHAQFKYGVPAILIAQVALVIYFFRDLIVK